MENYVILRVLGEGTFGRVYLARDVRSSTLVALKKVRVRRAEDGLPKVLMREIQALEKLGAESGGDAGLSRHVVQLREHFAQGSAVVLALEYMQADLQQVLHALSLVGQRLSMRSVRVCMRMLLRGVAGVHAQRVIHRDLKPSNLLFSPEGVLKLGDFGLARVHLDLSGPHGGADPCYSHEVATRWYRSPELLWGSRSYGFGVDVWACGAIFAEMLRGGSSPLFPGQNDIDQLYRVLLVRGTPTSKNWPGHDKLPDYAKIAFPHMDPQDLATLVHPETPQAAVQLLERMLTLDPAQRISAAEALAHSFFLQEEQEEHDTASEQGTKSNSTPRTLHASDEELMMELAALPALVKQWEQQQNTSSSPSSSAVPPPRLSSAAAVATASTHQQHVLPSVSSAAPDGSATSAVAATTKPAAAAATAPPATSGAAPRTGDCQDELRRLHLSGLDWAPSRPRTFASALQQLPSHAVPRASLLKQPAKLGDICPC